ncbi:phospholipase D-like domain-containing protein [Seongchinamella unica]|nr:phospholipase D-like domain-containing protein [Seongchinamella unica]
MNRLRGVIVGAWVVLLSACVSVDTPPSQCPAGRQALPNCPPLEAVDDPQVNRWYDARTWRSADEWDEDPIEQGIRAEIPVQSARMKLLGSRPREALYSLAAKIHAVENARYSIDAAYYIFKDDLVGRALLGALCEAVQRGVDVRLLVDSMGSISLDRNLLRALYQCQLQAGFIRNTSGELSTRRARVQVVLFNPISQVFANLNRRSHDKLLVVDGFVPDQAIVITGGRNISLSYYGIAADGTPNHDTYLDAELLLRPDPASGSELNVAEVSEIYFTLLNSFKNNRHIQGRVPPGRRTGWPEMEADLKRSLKRLKSLPPIAESLAAMPEYLASGYHFGEVRLAHEFANLINKRVVSDAVANLRDNPNSIMYLLTAIEDTERKHIRLVSPYLFAARYFGPDGELLLDEAAEIRRWLAADEERTYEIITNSVLTSDNFLAQSVVDTDMAPRLLLDEDGVAAWQNRPAGVEASMELVESDDWQRLVDNPRLRIYETGRLDDRLLGGDTDYGKLHAKYMISDDVGFLGTANFDYRSRLFNNEMGFFFRSDALTRDFDTDFEHLREKSYLWGSREWLEMRRALIDRGGIKGRTTQYQPVLYRFLRATGLEWLF